MSFGSSAGGSPRSYTAGGSPQTLRSPQQTAGFLHTCLNYTVFDGAPLLAVLPLASLVEEGPIATQQPGRHKPLWTPQNTQGLGPERFNCKILTAVPCRLVLPLPPLVEECPPSYKTDGSPQTLWTPRHMQRLGPEGFNYPNSDSGPPSAGSSSASPGGGRSP